jgi:hypothetical protein
VVPHPSFTAIPSSMAVQYTYSKHKTKPRNIQPSATTKFHSRPIHLQQTQTPKPQAQACTSQRATHQYQTLKPEPRAHFLNSKHTNAQGKPQPTTYKLSHLRIATSAKPPREEPMRALHTQTRCATPTATPKLKPRASSYRIKAKNLQGLLEKENKYNINNSEFVVLEDDNCALNLSELPKQKRASKRRFVPDCGTQPRINKRICVQNSNVARSLTENSSVNKKDTSDAVLGRQTMKESEVMPSNDLAHSAPKTNTQR